MERFTQQQSLDIAEQLLKENHFDHVVGKGPMGMSATVKWGRKYYNNDQKFFEENMKPLILESMGSQKDFSLEELKKKLNERKVEIPAEQISAAAKKIGITGSPTLPNASEQKQDNKESKPLPQVAVDAESKSPPTTATAEKPKDVTPSAPLATPPASTATSEDDAEKDKSKGLFGGMSDWYQKQKETFGEDRNPIQFIGFLLYALLSSFAGSLSDSDKAEQQKTRNEKKSEAKEQMQEQQQSQQVELDLDRAKEAQQDAKKPEIKDTSRDLVINHFGLGGTQPNIEDKLKFQELLAQSHVPDGTNVSPSVGKSNHTQVGPDMSFGRSIFS